jgi:Recombination endonuclease VII
VVDQPVSDRDRYLRRTHGITLAQYEEQLAAQGGKCMLCGKRPGKMNLVVDHDHVTGELRGLLHNRCNRALGPAEQSPVVMLRWVRYLQAILESQSKYHLEKEKHG